VRDAGELSAKEFFLGALMPRYYFHVSCEGTEPSTVWQMEVTDDAGNRIFLLFFRAEVSATAQRAPR
jgi:hypothetical protein